MTDLAELRAAIEATHDPDCPISYSCIAPMHCGCNHWKNVITALDALEKALTMCKEALDDGYTEGLKVGKGLYGDQHVNWVHKELTHMLDSSTAGSAGKEDASQHN